MEINKSLLVGTWTHQDWTFQLTNFHFLKIEWPGGGEAFGAWYLEDNEVIMSYVYKGKDRKHLYMFSIEEVIDPNTLRTRGLEDNKEEILKKVVD